MIIEAASTRLAIDLFQSLHKYNFTITDIRVSYLSENGTIEFRTFNTFEDLISSYNINFGTFVNSRRNPFTRNIKNSINTPKYKNGLLLYGNSDTVINSNSIKGFCELGKFVCVERFKIKSNTFNYDILFHCLDVSDEFKVIEGKQLNLRINSRRNTDMSRHKSSVESLIKLYKKILYKLFDVYNSNLYVDLCYVNIGYVEESIKLYSLFFMLVKERLDIGLRLNVLDKVYLKKM